MTVVYTSWLFLEKYVNTFKKNDEILFPDILKNVDNSVESTMCIELLNIIGYLSTKNSYPLVSIYMVYN